MCSSSLINFNIAPSLAGTLDKIELSEENGKGRRKRRNRRKKGKRAWKLKLFRSIEIIRIPLEFPLELEVNLILFFMGTCMEGLLTQQTCCRTTVICTLKFLPSTTYIFVTNFRDFLPYRLESFNHKSTSKKYIKES